MVKSLAITTVIVVVGPAFFPVLSCAISGAVVSAWGCTISKVLVTKALPIAVLSTHSYVLPDYSWYAALQETAIPAGFDPLSILNYHLLQAGEWTRSLGWVANE